MTDIGASPTSISLALDELCERASASLQAEQPGAAEQIYRAILDVEPKHPAANYHLGVRCMQLHQAEAGLAFLLAALEAKPEIAEYWLAYIEALLLDGQTSAAQQILGLGRQHGLEGKAFESLEARLSEILPAQAPPESPTSTAPIVPKKAKRKGAPPSAKDEATLVALYNQGRYQEGATLSKAMAERSPKSGFAWKALGVNLQQLGQDALHALRKAAELLPGDAEAQRNLGGALQALGLLEESSASFQRVLKINPNDADAYFNRGKNLQAIGHLNDAAASFRKALAIKPDLIAALIHLGHVLENTGSLDSALECYRRALKIDPGDVVAHGNLICCLSLSETVDAQSLFAEHCRFAEQFEAPLRVNWPQHTNSRDPGRCLQIGFVSPDLRNHAVANFIEPVLAHLADLPQLCLHAYFNHPVADDVTLRLRTYFDHWNPIFGLSNDALAQKISADGIDILIDLAGHSSRNRLLCFARKPAPLQLSWIGFPGTTGLTAMDYYVADRFFLPPGQFDAQFTEKIVRLPASAPFLPSKVAPLVNALPALTNGFITFGSFNRINKLSRAVVSLWAQLLRSLPDSRLLLGGIPENGNCDTLIEWFAQDGIDRERLDFKQRSNIAAYLALHHQVDICLDTFPYNGGTTTFHALWMGVPTLNLAGSTAAGRPGSSILGNVGLDEFVASSKIDFVEKGRYWAEHLAELASIRAGLRLCFEHSAGGQPKVIAMALVHALRHMWQRWCVGLPAESFDVSWSDAADREREAGQ